MKPDLETSGILVNLSLVKKKEKSMSFQMIFVSGFRVQDCNKYTSVTYTVKPTPRTQHFATKENDIDALCECRENGLFLNITGPFMLRGPWASALQHVEFVKALHAIMLFIMVLKNTQTLTFYSVDQYLLRVLCN